MARASTFKINGKEFSTEPTKVERKKLYGWTELVVTDSEGNQCRKASLNSDGVIIIDQGATKLGMIDDNGTWVTKDELVAVDSKGDKVELVKSSFETGCELDRKVSVEELLTINVTSMYQLEGEEVGALTEAVGKDIFRFDFNYYTDYSPGRKEQLNRNLRVSNTEEQPMKLFEDMLAENIKKGWKEVE